MAEWTGPWVDKNCSMSIDPDVYEEVWEALSYILDVGIPTRKVFQRLVDEGSDGSEEHRITGDDLGGFCHHVNRLAEIFEVPISGMRRTQIEIARVNERHKK